MPPSAANGEASTTAAILTAKREEREKRGPASDPNGYDERKEDKGKKRTHSRRHAGFTASRTFILPIFSDRDGGILLLATLFGMYLS